MEVKIKIENLERIRRAFRKSPAVVKKHMDIAMEKSAWQVVRDSKISITEMGAVDTGRLRASIGGGGFRGGSYPTGEGVKVSFERAEIGTNVEYAPFVHFGTRFMKARPFLKRGGEKAIPEINRFFREAGNNITKEIAGT